MNAAATEGAYLDTTTARGITIGVSGIVVQWMGFKSDQPAANYEAIFANTGNVQYCDVNHCLFVCRNMVGGPSPYAGVLFRHGTNCGFHIVSNCAMIGDWYRGIWFRDQDFGCKAYNITYHTQSTNSQASAVAGSTANVNDEAYNILHFHENIDAGINSGDYLGSSFATTIADTTDWVSLVDTDVFVSVTKDAEDVRLKESVKDTLVGGDYSGTIGSLDLGGNTRSVWNIGAMEFIEADPRQLHYRIGGLLISTSS